MERFEIDANGLTFSARTAGDPGGRPVLLLHGFPETSWEWRHVMPRLAEQGYRAVAPDLRGYSPAARPTTTAAYAISHLLDDVIALADTLEMSTFDLVGHDWGGLLAWVTAARHPERLRTLFVLSTPHPEALRAFPPAVPHEFFDRFLAPGEAENLLLATGASRLRELYAGVDEEGVSEYIACFSEPGVLTAALEWFRAASFTEIENLPPIVVPTRFAWSTGDPVLPREAAVASAEWVAGAYHFDLLDHCGHWIPEEDPDEFARVLLEHLASI